MVLVTQQEVRKIRVCSTETGVCAEMSRKRRYYCSVMKLDLTGLSQRDYMGDRGHPKRAYCSCTDTKHHKFSQRTHNFLCISRLSWPQVIPKSQYRSAIDLLPVPAYLVTFTEPRQRQPKGNQHKTAALASQLSRQVTRL